MCHLAGDYPSLSALARSQGEDLCQIAGAAKISADQNLTLATCLNLVLHPEHLGREGFHQYLATIDAFVRCTLPDPISSPTRSKQLWNKLTGGSVSSVRTVPRGTAFLDAVVEAAWYVRFLSNRIKFRFERPFDRSNAASKNADFAVELGGTTFWLEAYSVELPQVNRRPTSTSVIDGFLVGSFPAASHRPEVRAAVAADVAERAKQKYDSKFRAAVGKGELGGSPVGILVCLVKSGPSRVGPFLLGPPDVQPVLRPQNLFDGRYPNLEVVWVHTLHCPPKGDRIQLPLLWKWVRDADDPVCVMLVRALRSEGC